MSRISDRLLIAARARASGLSWKATAELVKRGVTTVHRWPRKYANEWTRLYEIAQTETQDEAGAEAVGVLRKQMRSADVKIAHASAKALLVWFSRPVRRATSPMLPTDQDRVTAYLHHLSDSEKKALHGHLSELDAIDG